MNFPAAETVKPAGNSAIASVGAWLQGIRAEKGITLDEISKVTRIGKDYLVAIEEGNASKLPSQAYTRGFIRLYAAHLELSPDEALSMLDNSHTEPVVTNRPSIHSRQKTGISSPYRLTIILTTLLTLALLSGYFLLSEKAGRTSQQQSRIDTSQQHMAEKIPANSEEQTLPKNDSLPAPPPQQSYGDNFHKEGIILRLKAIKDGKVHITIDGSVSQEYDLASGDLVEWKAESAFTLDLENAASVEGELDGRPLKPFGEAGKAVHLLLKADGMHKE